MASHSFKARREEREPVEMMARFRHGVSTIMVMLRDISPHGVRIEGIGRLERDDATYLVLPNMKPRLSFVAWSNEHGAGLEFCEPLDGEVFASLVRSFGRKAQGTAMAA